MPTPNSPPMSLSAYAKRRGVSAEAVSKAVADGRLQGAVVRVRGVPKIADPDLADREWDANTRIVTEQRGPHDHSDYYAARARRESAAAEREAADAELAKIKLADKRGELVLAADIEARLVATFTNCRNKLLGIPSRLGQAMPLANDRAIVQKVEDLIYEALEDLAGTAGS